MNLAPPVPLAKGEMKAESMSRGLNCWINMSTAPRLKPHGLREAREPGGGRSGGEYYLFSQCTEISSALKLRSARERTCQAQRQGGRNFAAANPPTLSTSPENVVKLVDEYHTLLDTYPGPLRRESNGSVSGSATGIRRHSRGG